MSASVAQKYADTSIKLAKNGVVRPAELVQFLPAVSSVVVRQNSCTEKQLFFYAKEPFLIINNQYVLTTDGTLVKKNDYEERYVLTLPLIQCDQSLLKNPQLSKDFLSFFLKIDERYLKMYRWTVFSEHHIAVKIPDREIEVLFTAASLIPNLMLERCVHLDEIIKLERHSKKNIYDARFENQIIVR